MIPSKNTQESPEKEAQWTKDRNRLFKEEERKENGLYIAKKLLSLAYIKRKLN